MKTPNDYMEKSYRMEITEVKDEGRFVVSYPDLPGCITCGENIECSSKCIRCEKDMAYRKYV